jgi:hypothetical protein
MSGVPPAGASGGGDGSDECAAARLRALEPWLWAQHCGAGALARCRPPGRRAVL